MGKETLPLYVVEAFTKTDRDNGAFTGNTAAVCLLDFDDDLTDEIKQKMAMNMNLSETAFATRGWTHNANFEDPLRWTVRWFTPTTEVALCGHATLATSNVIFNEILKEKYSFEEETSIVFESKFNGLLGATMNWSTGLITLDFPANLTVPVTVEEHPWLATVIETTLGADLRPEVIEDIHYAKGMGVIMLRLRDTKQDPAANEAILKKVRPDFAGQLAVKVPQGVVDLKFVMTTIKGNSDKGGPNFFSRFFATWAGVDEDPVCGSAHTILAPFWMKEFQKEGVHLDTLVGIQSSKRGGRLICNLKDDRVHITGSTRMTLKGNFIF